MDKDLALAFRQLARALLTEPGEFHAECADDCEPYCGQKWGVVLGRTTLVYEYEFSEVEAEIIAMLLNTNPDLDWLDMNAIVEVFAGTEDYQREKD